MKIDLANLEKAQEKLGRIVTVAKSGELTPEAQQDLASKLAEFVGLFGVEESDAPTAETVEAASPAELKAELESLKKDLANMTVTAGISDLAVDEQVDAVQAKIDAVLARIAEPPKAESDSTESSKPEQADAAKLEPEAQVAQTASELQSEPEPEVQATAPETEPSPEPEPEVSDDTEKNKAETFTADNMKEMFQSFMDGMKSVIKDAVEGATKQVSKQLAAPVTLPASRGTGSIEEFNASEKQSKADDDSKAYLEAYDFNAWIDKDDARLD